MTGELEARCELCNHFAQHPQMLDVGQCSHSPPVPIQLPQGITSMFPIVARVNRCGQFKARDQAAGQAEGQGNSRLLRSDN